MWTVTELRSNIKDYSGEVWRVVEAQHHVSTMRLASDLESQTRLEALAEEVKPRLPAAARGLHWLLASPFRYWHRSESRFRRANEKPGIFYGAEQERTALSEAAYWRLRFFSRSPGLKVPLSTTTYTSFRVQVASGASIDLCGPPFDRDRSRWIDPKSYEACQALASVAREASVQCIRSESARDPEQGCNLVVLAPEVFRGKEPELGRNWRLRCEAGRVSAQADFVSGEAYLFRFQSVDNA